MTEQNVCGWCHLPFKFEGAVSNPEAIKICQCRSPQPKPLGMTTKVGPIDPIYNKLLTDAFSAHTKGRMFGEEEMADAFEHFKAGFDKNYSPVAPTEAMEDKWKAIAHEMLAKLEVMHECGCHRRNIDECCDAGIGSRKVWCDWHKRMAELEAQQ